jgi:uncharacterized protein (TIGR02452 family)
MPSRSANETLAVLERGHYRAPSGNSISIRAEVEQAVEGTVLYRPGDLAGPFAEPTGAGRATIEVTAETTTAAICRLAGEGLRVAALNFASARNVGGGFLGGAKAQEEDLCRCSALYPCLLAQRAYYDANRACASLLYTDHVIYSPDVPFFRDDRLALLEVPALASIITAPAPNAGALGRGGRAEGLREALGRRGGYVLQVAARHAHRVLVLGAWGCGVFRNDPSQVADAFARALAGPFRAAFDRVTFAIYDRTRDRCTLRAFQERFGS